ncbi:DeoR/GlpR family DNA-binding transcription regulator [Muricomes intestini]|uniref:DeoR/GlpR family DNA-binding transcription regulator n=1 Tax=Muricomes intestini TaxID=1796634 RepID=UPI002FE1C28A
MYSLERKKEILKMLNYQDSLSVNYLAEHFHVSKETIRRDLRQLEEAGKATRMHGGIIALPSDPSNQPACSALPSMLIPEPPVKDREMNNTEIKRTICRKAASYIEPGDNVYVDNSSTTIYLPEYISNDIPVTFISNSILFLVEAAKYNKPNLTFICLGGIFKGANLSTHGYITIENAGDYYPNKAFLSCTGITSFRSITDSSIEETTIKKYMIDRSREVFLLADHTKFLQDGQIFLSSFDSVQHVITDTLLDSVDYTFLTNRNINVISTD